jgi:hypothetical protein
MEEDELDRGLDRPGPVDDDVGGNRVIVIDLG